MSFLETPRFPDDIAFWARGGPGFNTTVVVVNSGDEYRNANWANTRARYDISQGLRTRNLVADAIIFFRAVGGRAHGFRFKDFMDFEVTISNTALIYLSTAGSYKKYQLAKIYTAGAMTHTRKIQKPVASTFKAYKNGAQQLSGFGLDPASGILTVPNTADSWAWTGEFDVPVRFDTDEMRGGMGESGLYEWEGIPLIEIRIRDTSAWPEAPAGSLLLIGTIPTVAIA